MKGRVAGGKRQCLVADTREPTERGMEDGEERGRLS